MEIKYQIFKEDSLLIEKYFGIFSPEDYFSYNQHVLKKISSDSINKVLIDFRELKFWEMHDEMPDDFNETFNYVVNLRKRITKDNPDHYNVNIVIWVINPLPTAIAHLFIKNFSGMNYSYCSTMEKVIVSLGIPTYKNRLENIIQNLNRTF